MKIEASVTVRVTREQAAEVCRVLGLDPNTTTSVTIIAGRAAAATLTEIPEIPPPTDPDAADS